MILVLGLATTGCGNISSSLSSLFTSPIGSSDPPAAAREQKAVFSGDSFTLEPTGGTPPYTYSVSTSGYLNTTTGVYTVPTNAPPISEDIDVTDANGDVFGLTVSTKGFVERLDIALPQGADDQNFPSDSVWLSTGEIFVSAVGSDYQGERWAVYRSEDVGASWQRMDHFLGMSYDGESHPLSMAATGNTVFTCGYSYDYDATLIEPNSQWEVRRSTDAGDTWQSVDRWFIHPGNDHVCYDIAVAPGTGYVYTAGYYDTATERRWLIKESRDNGATWSIIYDQRPIAAGSSIAFQIDVSPNGKLFVLGQAGAGSDLYFLLGEEILGTWNWTPSSSIPAGMPFGDYELRGTLKVISNTTAFYAYRESATGRVLRTLDAGNTWTQVYAGHSFLQGLTVTSSGDIIASGGVRGGVEQWYTVRSTDNGATWTPLDMEALLVTGKSPSGGTIVASPSGNSVMAFAFNDIDYQISTALSTDDGVSWTQQETVRFLWAFYDEISAMVRTSPNHLYITATHADEDSQYPWTVMRSTNNGTSWSVVDTFFDTSYARIGNMIVGHDSGIYISGWSGSQMILRRSTNGTAWATVLTLPTAQTTGHLFSRGTTDTFYILNNTVSSAVDVYRSTNGTAWSQISTIGLPAGIERNFATGIQGDAAGNLYVAIGENDTGPGTTVAVIYKSTDGGLTWSEIRRNAFSPYNGLVKVQNGTIYFVNGQSLETSTDGGTTWATDTAYNVQPQEITFIDGTLYLYGANPNGGGNWVVYVRNATLGTWAAIEDMDAREEDLKLEGKYYGWIPDPAFLEISESEVYLNTVYGDPYWGYRGWLRALTTGD